MIRRSILHLLVVLTTLLAAASAAAEVSISVNPTLGTVNDTFELSVTVSGHRASSLSNPEFTEVAEFAVRRSGTSTQRQYINGEKSFSISFNFTVYPSQSLKAGEYKLPKGSIAIDGKQFDLDQPSIQIVSNSTSGQRNSRQAVQLSQSTDRAEVYVGQQLTYQIRIVSNNSFLGGELEEFQLKGFLEESFGNQGQRSTSTGANRVTTISKVLIPTKAGTNTIPARVLAAKIQAPGSTRARSPRSIFGSFPFGRRGRTVMKRYSTSPLEIEVKPLPPAPPGYTDYIPTGRLTLRTNVDGQTITQGESVTLTLTLSGSGNLRPFDLPEPIDTTNSFKRYDEKPVFVATQKGSKMFYRKTFKIAFVPTSSGNLSLPRFRIVYFDPQDEKFHTLLSDEKVIEVAPDPNERLLVSGVDQNDTVSTSEKQEVEIVGEGLLPQREGRSLYEKQHPLPRWLLLLVLFLAPSLAILISYYQSRNRLLISDPLRKAQLQAQKNALSKFESSTQLTAEDLHGIITSYIGDRFRLRGDSITVKEAREIVNSQTGLPLVAEELHSLLNTLQNQIYSGKSSSKAIDSSLIEVAKNSIQQIERGCSK